MVSMVTMVLVNTNKKKKKKNLRPGSLTSKLPLTEVSLSCKIILSLLVKLSLYWFLGWLDED